MIILIDNYDSFTYNLVQYLGDMKQEVNVYRNDKITAQEVVDLKPSGVVISPGPGEPEHAGICLEMVEVAAQNNLPLFGVCLGMQAIGQFFGGDIVRAPTPMHGKTSTITHSEKGIFSGLPKSFDVTRYHSLIVDKGTLPECLSITAQTNDGLIMGLSHKEKPIHGVQFHPESIATQYGHSMLKNFIGML